MAHFAELNQDNVVLRVIVIHNDELLDENKNESELKGVEFCKNLFGGNWIQTSYSGSIRKNYAGVGYLYDIVRDAFIPPQPFPSWVLNENTCIWEAPVACPGSFNSYYWDEEKQVWVEVKI